MVVTISHLLVFPFLDHFLYWLDRVSGIHGGPDQIVVHHVHLVQHGVFELFIYLFEMRCPLHDCFRRLCVFDIISGFRGADDGAIYAFKLDHQLQLRR